MDEAFASIERLSQANFKESGIYAERFVERARHVEVQVFGDGRGRVVALGERDCSAQRRNQKVIEETPAPGQPETSARCARLGGEALPRGELPQRRHCRVHLDGDRDQFYFLEVNTRLQVEHGVTEEVTGVDLVEWMVRLAAGDPFRWRHHAPDAPGRFDPGPRHAEDPGPQAFRPSAGILTEAIFPLDAVRVDTGVERGGEITPCYDPMMAKIIVRGEHPEPTPSPSCGQRWTVAVSTASRPISATCASWPPTRCSPRAA